MQSRRRCPGGGAATQASIGSPCLRHCVHGASIARMNGSRARCCALCCSQDQRGGTPPQDARRHHRQEPRHPPPPRGLLVSQSPNAPLNTFIRPVRGGGGICPPPFPIPPLSLTAAPVWFEQRRPCRQRDGAAADRPRPGPPTRERRGCGEWSEIDRRPSERAAPQADPCARTLLRLDLTAAAAGFVGGLAGGGWLPPPQITLLSEAWSELEAERARLGAELLASAEVVPRPPPPRTHQHWPHGTAAPPAPPRAPV
jgi:hypothetical protein